MHPIEPLIHRYEQDGDLPAQAIRGLTEDDLNATPIAGTWSIKQIVLHLMDSDLVASDRMKRIICEDRPLLIGNDESAAAANLPWQHLDAALACALFRSNRCMTARLLRHLPESAFARCGVHNQTGIRSIRDILQTYVDHVPHHMTFLRRKRELLGKPLPPENRT